MNFESELHSLTGKLLSVKEHKSVELGCKILKDAIESKTLLLIGGNGGSAAQSSHFAGELVGRFKKDRMPIKAINMNADSGVLTCISNDYGYENIYSRYIEAFSNEELLVILFTTSGRSSNILKALKVAKRKNIQILLLTGNSNQSFGNNVHEICFPSTNTALIQTYHLIVLHYWCAVIDEHFAKE